MKIIPELMVDNMEAAVAFYGELLGFSVIMKVPDNGPTVWASLKNDEAEIMLYLRSAFEEEIPAMKSRSSANSGAVLYLKVENAADLYEKVKTKAVIVKELHETDYGSKEFAMIDNSGYVVIVGE